MASGERIDTYYGQLKEILLRLPHQELLDAHIMRQFINGLYPPSLKAYLKKISSIILPIAYQQAKLWEEIHLGETYMSHSLAQQSYINQVGVRRNDLGNNNIPTYIQSNYVNVVPMASAPMAPMLLVEYNKVNLYGNFIPFMAYCRNKLLKRRVNQIMIEPIFGVLIVGDMDTCYLIVPLHQIYHLNVVFVVVSMKQSHVGTCKPIW